MWGQFFNVDEPESIHIYQTSRLEDGFYKYQFKTNFPSSIVLIDSGILCLNLNKSLWPDIPAQPVPVKLC